MSFRTFRSSTKHFALSGVSGLHEINSCLFSNSLLSMPKAMPPTMNGAPSLFMTGRLSQPTRRPKTATKTTLLNRPISIPFLFVALNTKIRGAQRKILGIPFAYRHPDHGKQSVLCGRFWDGPRQNYSTRNNIKRPSPYDPNKALKSSSSCRKIAKRGGNSSWAVSAKTLTISI